MDSLFSLFAPVRNQASFAPAKSNEVNRSQSSLRKNSKLRHSLRCLRFLLLNPCQPARDFIGVRVHPWLKKFGPSSSLRFLLLKWDGSRDGRGTALGRLNRAKFPRSRSAQRSIAWGIHIEAGLGSQNQSLGPAGEASVKNKAYCRRVSQVRWGWERAPAALTCFDLF